MPFKSESQRRYLWANHPEIARRWSKKYGSDSMQPVKKPGGNVPPWMRGKSESENDPRKVARKRVAERRLAAMKSQKGK